MQIKLKNKSVTTNRPTVHSYKLLFLLMAIVISTALVSCTSASTGMPPASPQQPGTSEPSPTPTTEPAVMEQVSYVTVEELLQKMQSQADVLVIDARLKEYYDADHIKGALSLPYSTVVSRDFVLPPAKEIVVYCSCPDADTSIKTALELIKQGFPSVKVLEGGYTAWKDKGYPTQAGEGGKNG